MSALSEQARSAMKEKAQRLTRSSTGKIDASGWREPLGMNADKQTGPSPVSRRQFKSGGKVTGLVPPKHAGRKPRAAGGVTKVDGSLIDKDVKEARGGNKHVGGMKHGGSCTCPKCGGGAVKRANGGRTDSPGVRLIDSKGPNRILNDDYVERQDARSAGVRPKSIMKGIVEDAKLSPEALSAKNAARMAALKRASGKATGGASMGGNRPKGDRIARKHGGRSKSGTKINIIIAPPHGGAQAGMPPPMPPPGPIGMRQGMPPPPGAMPPGGAPPPMAPPGGGMPPPGLMRKAGGRVADGHFIKPGKYPIKDGAGGGKGRLQKARAYG